MLDADENPEIRRQYARWLYPAPVDNLDPMVRGETRLRNDPWNLRHFLWPDRPWRPVRVLVAGCGTQQAAMLAACNRDCAIIGVDVSAPSLAETDRLRRLHGLDNLELRELSLFDAGRIGGRFDVIYASGVLHHLPDPEAGGRALREVLEPDGRFCAMLYGLAARVGVYMLQTAFRIVGLRQDERGVETVRKVFAALPERHPAVSFAAPLKDMQEDAGVVDLFLNPQDRGYTVPDVMAFADSLGMPFHGWVDPAWYAPENRLPEEIVERLSLRDLPEAERATVVEMLTQTISQHEFVLRAPGPPPRVPDFADPSAWLDWRPSPSAQIRPVERVETAEGPRVRLRRNHWTIEVTEAQALCLVNADGRNTVLELVLAHFQHDPAGGFFEAKSFFEKMYRFGHIFFDISEQ